MTFTSCLNGRLEWRGSSSSDDESSDSAGEVAPTESEEEEESGGGGGGSGGSGSGGGGGGGSLGGGAPQIRSVSPETGSWRGGFSFTVYGANFLEGASVEVGGVSCEDAVVDPRGTSITCIMPELETPGLPADVVVTNSNESSAKLEQGFTSQIFTYVVRANEILRFSLGGSNAVLANETVAYTFTGTAHFAREIVLHPTQPLLFVFVDVSTGGPDLIYSFEIDPATGDLRQAASVTSGILTQNLCLTERFVHIVEQGQGTGILTTHQIDHNGNFGASGAVRTGSGPISCETRRNRDIYVLNGQSHNISRYQSDGSVNLFQFPPSATWGDAPITMGISPDGGYILAPSAFTLHYLRIETDGELSDFQTPAFPGAYSFTSIAFNPLNDRFYMSQTEGANSVQTWNLNGEVLPSLMGTMELSGVLPMRTAVSPRGDALIVSNATSSSVTVNRIDRNGNVSTETDSKSVGSPRDLVIY